MRRLPVLLLLLLTLAPAARAEDDPKAKKAEPEHPLVLEARTHSSRAKDLFRAKRFDEARAEFLAAAAIYEKVPDPENAGWMYGWICNSYFAEGNYAKALEAARDQYRLQEGVFGDRPVLPMLIANGNMGASLRETGRPGEALPYYERQLVIAEALHGSVHAKVVEVELKLGATLRALERHPEAVGHFQRALAIARRVHTKPHALVAYCIDSLADCYRGGLRRPDKALPLCEEHLRITRALFGKDHVEIAGSLRGLANGYRGLGRHADAKPLLEESLAMLRRLGMAGTLRYALTLGTLGLVLDMLRDYEGALACQQEALTVQRTLHAGDSRGVASALHNVAYVLDSLERYDEALEHIQQALAMRRRIFRGDHGRVALGLNGVGTILENMGRAAEAIPYYEKAIAMRQRLVRGDDPSRATYTQNLASAYQSLGRHAEALPYDRQALAMFDRLFPGDHLERADARNAVAFRLGRLGRPGEALPLFREALAMYGRLYEGNHPRLCRAYNNVGSMLWRLGRGAEALPMFEASVAMERALHPGLDRPDMAKTLINIGLIHSDRGNTEQALARFMEGLAIQRKNYVGDHADIARSLYNAAGPLWDLGRKDEAREHARDSLEMARRLGSPETHIRAVRVAWQHLETSGQEAKAIPLYAEAIAQVEALRGHARGLALRDRAAYHRQLKRHSPYHGMVLAQVEAGRADEALRYAERGRARESLDMLALSRFDAMAEARRRARLAGDKATLAKLASVEERLARASAAAGKARHALAAGNRKALAERRILRAALDEAEQDLLELERERARLLADLLPLTRTATPEEIQRTLRPGERVLMYALSWMGSVVFDVPPPGAPVRAFPLRWEDGAEVTRATAAKAVSAYREALLDRTEGEEKPGSWTDAEGLREGHRLFRALMPAALWKDVKAAPSLVVVPHGALHSLPFETLIVRAGRDTFWLDEGPPIAYVPSGSVFAWCRRRAREAGRSKQPLEILALGDPIFARTRGGVIDPPAYGALVLTVEPGSRAKDAGVRPGDVIRAYGDEEIEDTKTLGRARLAIQEATEEGARSGPVRLRIWRMGEEGDLQITPGRLGIRIAMEPLEAIWPKRGELGLASVERSGVTERFGRLVSLPGTRRELVSIGASLGRVAARSEASPAIRLLLGEDASKANLFELAPKARYLHLATHQLVDETHQGSFSRLALTLPRVATPQDDGFLTLHEIIEQWRDRLSGCELVVLSACESHRGHLQRDEAPMALPLGFLYAGAPCVVGSLWRVDDESTADLMGDFYAALGRAGGASKARAFTDARKRLRAQRAEPYYWAPFVFVGDAR